MAKTEGDGKVTVRAATWEDYVTMAPHYLAIGQTTIHTGKYAEDIKFPWAFASELKSSSMLDQSSNNHVDILAAHPSGLTFTKTVYLFKSGRDEKGYGEMVLDAEAIMEAMVGLQRAPNAPNGLLAKFHNHLHATADQVRQDLAEGFQYIIRKSSGVAALEMLAETELPTEGA